MVILLFKYMSRCRIITQQLSCYVLLIMFAECYIHLSNTLIFIQSYERVDIICYLNSKVFCIRLSVNSHGYFIVCVGLSFSENVNEARCFSVVYNVLFSLYVPYLCF